MKASIIIPTFGRPVALRRALESIMRIEPRSCGAEIIVVDNNDDPSICDQVRAAATAAGEPVRYVAEPSPGLGAARHRGAHEAHGDALIFIDDDVQVSPSWLGSIITAFDDPSVGLAGGPSIPRFLGAVPSWFWDFIVPAPPGGWGSGWLSLLDIGRTVVDVDPNMIWGLNFSIRRQLLRTLGGFHPDVVPASLQRWQGDGETGLTMKAQASGVRSVYLQEALLHHMVGPDRLTADYFAKRAYYQAVCDSFTRIRAGAPPSASDDAPVMPGIQQDGRWSDAARGVWTRCADAYRQGWLFHQREAASDPQLLAWIRREHYWDADIREEMRKRASGAVAQD